MAGADVLKRKPFLDAWLIDIKQIEQR